MHRYRIVAAGYSDVTSPYVYTNVDDSLVMAFSYISVDLCLYSKLVLVSVKR